MIQRRAYTEAQLHDLVGSLSKSDWSKNLARECLKDPNHELWNRDTNPTTA